MTPPSDLTEATDAAHSHTCHAHGCTVKVAPKYFMCPGHWYSVPDRLRKLIWSHYRPGQEIDKSPTEAYLCIASECIGEVAFKPFDEQAAKDAAPYLLRAQRLRKRIIDAGGNDPLPWMVKYWEQPAADI